MYRSRLRAISTIRRSGTASVESCSWWIAARLRHVQAAPARVAQAAGEVDLVGVDEEVRVEVADLLGRLAPHEQRRRLAPVDLARLRAAALHGEQAVQQAAPRRAPSRRGKAPRRGLLGAVRAQQPRARAAPRRGARSSARHSASVAPGCSSESSFSSSA